VPEELLREIDKLPTPQSARFEWKTMSLDEQRRQKLFGFIEKLVQWENSNDEYISFFPFGALYCVCDPSA
jgi:hypothetical protein